MNDKDTMTMTDARRAHTHTARKGAIMYAKINKAHAKTDIITTEQRQRYRK
jgi:hypothetical protein